ncbi:unnamed protein product [Oncorhynchus mykiss]|uniref:SH3 domain-containing protein n=1 Tax=Oncorhynchus mykiss TaxID=8022 RepID=A0A060Y4N5_ONCMY|nr:unnamed protein product [Oncorhynchus mykiss]
MKVKKGEPSSPDANSSPITKGWTKGSLSLDANEENDGYSSTEEPLTSDPEDEGGKKLCAGKYTVVSDYEKCSTQDLSVKSGETVQLIKEGEDGQWFVKNLKTKQEGWVAAANLYTLIGESTSCQSLTSSGTTSSPSRYNYVCMCVCVCVCVCISPTPSPLTSLCVCTCV